MGKSVALETWLGERAKILDEFEAVHRRVGGEGPGRRYLTDQLNRGYLLAVGAQFQGFCRDLHSEAAAAVVATLPIAVQPVVTENLTFKRNLDMGNPRAGALGSDFGRLGVKLWPDVGKRLKDGAGRNARLEQLMIWRNSIAHSASISTTDEPKVGTTRPTFAQVKAWRNNLNVLANAFDPIIRAQMRKITGSSPW